MMGKFITVPSSYVLYEVEDDVFQVISSGSLTLPPQVVLELMVVNGQAKRLGKIETLNLESFSEEEESEEDDDEEPEEGKGPWLGEG